jgi:hypothetical protein
MINENDPESIFLRDLNLRTPSFKRNPDLENLLHELAIYLTPVEAEIEKKFDTPIKPPLFLVGNPRSGTSVFMQLLALSDVFAIPTNILSRFYYAPFIGAKIQELLTNPKFDYKNELAEENSNPDLFSNLGRTKGKLAPSEILHFWRRFLPRYDPQYLNEEECEKIDIQGLRRGVAAIESVFDKPFAAKAFMLQYNLDVLLHIFPNCLVINLQRNYIFLMQSILLARETHYNNRSIWWSVKPKQYGYLKDMDFYHQIAGQVYYTERALNEQMLRIPNDNKLIIEYEDLCSNPKSVANEINKKYANLGLELNMKINMIDKLEPKNTIRIEAQDIQKLKKAYEYFESLH